VGSVVNSDAEQIASPAVLASNRISLRSRENVSYGNKGITRFQTELGNRCDANHDNEGQHHGVLNGCWSIFVNEKMPNPAFKAVHGFTFAACCPRVLEGQSGTTGDEWSVVAEQTKF
jgi:hypothetical protein